MRETHYPYVDRNNPEAAATCDRGGEVRKHSELRKEMQWRGNRLVWNGMLCCEHHIDPPQPQDRLLILKPDPVPVKTPRPYLPMTPKPGYLTDGIGDTTQTSDYVQDGHNAPIRDTP